MMQPFDAKIIKQAIIWLSHQPVWLCTVLKTYGSAPRSPGALMVATRDGRYYGSLSGGCIEEDFLRRIAGGQYSAASQIVRYGEGGIAPNVALPCGGILEVLVEFLPANEQNIHYLQTMANALEGHGAFLKRIVLPYACQGLEALNSACHTIVNYDQQEIKLTISAAPRLLIAGLSNVAIYCADFARALGFEVLICEAREAVLANFVDQLTPEMTLLRQFPAKFIENGGCHANTAVVALTHDPRIDDLTLMEAIYTSAFYIGAMGSEKNSAKRYERLKRIAGFSDAQLTRIHAPIGIKIGSKTPAEIALSVMADIVSFKNRHLQL